MPWLGFEPTIAASERAKAVHVSDRSATVTGTVILTADKLTLEHRSSILYLRK
jgi:hypothetical protein